MPESDAIERQQFSVDETWSKKDEGQKQDYYNQALKEREQDLKNAREQLQMLRSYEHESSAVVGSLVALAYQLNEAAAHRAMMEEDEVPESIESIREQFQEALTISLEHKDEEITLSPSKVQELSEQVPELGRPPYYLRELMEQNGTQLRNLIGLAYAGTEVMTEGSSDEDKPEM